RNRDPQTIKSDEMGEGDGEGREDRDGEDLVGDGDAGQGDNGHPDEIEDCDRNPDRFRAQPVEPADREFAFLLARETAAARQEMTPVLSQNLEAAIGPPVALLLISLESVGEEAVAVASVGIMDLPAVLEHEQAEIAGL